MPNTDLREVLVDVQKTEEAPCLLGTQKLNDDISTVQNVDPAELLYCPFIKMSCILFHHQINFCLSMLSETCDHRA